MREGNKSVRRARALVMLLLVMLVPIFLRAQVDRGTVNGTISDSSGAVIPGVKVTATNVETGVLNTAISNGAGFYSILNLPIGHYRLTFQQQGFSTLERDGITLSVSQVAEINVTLSAGSTTQTVVVNDNAPILDTETSTTGSDVRSALITALPLNVAGGRDAENFAFAVMPGVEGNPWTANINGTQAFTKDVKVDGVSLTSTVQGDQMETGPSMEAVQEVNVQTSGLTAENASTNGGVEMFTLKSGTNEFHGSAFGYGHNEILDANTWSNNNQGIRKAKSRFWDWGFSAGGPILKNRLFVFGAYERYQQSNFTMGALAATVPTPAFLSGDFSTLLNTNVVLGTDSAGNTIYQGAIFDPTTGNVFPGNVIPSGRISKVSQNIVKIYQESYQPATSALSNNEFVPASNSPAQTHNNFSIKIDENLTAKNHLSVSWIYVHSPRTLVNQSEVWQPGSTTGGPFTDARVQLVNANSFRISDSHAFTANLLNIASLAYNRYFNGNEQINTGNWPQTLGFGNTGAPNFPVISFGAARQGVAESTIGNSWTNHEVGEAYILNESLSWVHGRHTLKFGVELWHQPMNSTSGTGAMSFSFDPSQTGAPSAKYASRVGFGFASFLLGNVYSANSSSGLLLHGRRSARSLFAQDDWRATQKLTLNLGLRWDETGPLTEKDGRWANFNTGAANSVLGVPGVLQFAKNGGSTFETNSDYLQFGPHVGAAYQVTRRLVGRAGYGIIYSPVGTNQWEGVPYGFAPQTSGTNLVNPTGKSTPAFSWDNGYPGVYKPGKEDILNLTWGQVSIDPDARKQGYTHQWNAGVEFEITKNLKIDANYVGNRGVHLHDGNLAFNEPDSATFLKLMNSNQEWAWVSDPGSAAAAGVNYPYAGFQGFAYQAIAPYPQVALTYGPIYYAETPKGKTSYDALQLEVTKRTGALTLDMSYTQGRSRGNTNSNFEETWTSGQFQDYTKLDEEAKVPAPNDQRHVLKGYVAYELPFGRGQRFFSADNAVLDKFVSGWQATALVHYNSGTPLYIYAVNPYPYGSWAAVYPNVNMHGDFSRKFHAGRYQRVSGSQAPTSNQYFLGANFSPPAWGTLGTGPEGFDALRGFGYADEDAALLKNTHFGHDNRFNLSIRVEFYDLLNRHYFNNPNTDMSSPNFGYVTSVQGTSRNGQFGARFQW
jgi:Carboxypeptidase regulatory-like domain